MKIDIKSELHRLDPNLDESHDNYKAAAVLLASLELGPNQRKIAKALGYPPSLVAKFADNLKKNGVWKNGKIYGDWFDKETGGTGFWMDVCVALGFFKRV